MNQNAINILISAKDMASGVLGGVGGAIRGVGNIALGVAKGMVAVGTAVAGFAGIVVKNTSDLEQNEVAFTAMLKSADRAKTLLKDLSNFAKKTPFELGELQDVTKQLLAYGFAQEKIIPLLTTVGNISAGVGKDKMPILIRALGQIQAKGKLAGQEFLQLTETGLPIADALAKRLGITTQELTGNVSDLNISYETVEKTIKDIEKNQFNNLMLKQSATLEGIWSNIKDTFVQTTQEIGKQTGLFDFIKGVVGGVLDTMGKLSPVFIDIIKSAGQFIGEWTSEAGTRFGTLIKDLGDRFGNLKTAFMGILKPSDDTKASLKNMMDTVLSGTLNILSGKNGLVQQFSNFISWLSKPETIDLFTYAIGSLMDALQNIKPILQAVSSLIKGIVSGIITLNALFGQKEAIKISQSNNGNDKKTPVPSLNKTNPIVGPVMPNQNNGNIYNIFNNTTVDPNVLSNRLNFQLKTK